MKKENKSNIHVIPQLKGGVGKTTIQTKPIAVIVYTIPTYNILTKIFIYYLSI